MNRCDVWANIIDLTAVSGQPVAALISIPDGELRTQAVVSIPPNCACPDVLQVGMRVYVCGRLMPGQLMPGMPWIEAQYISPIEPGLRETGEEPSYMTLIEGIRAEKPRSRRRVAEEAKELV